MIRISIVVGSSRTEVGAAHGASARDVEKPGVDAFGVELVVAGENADILTFSEVIRADGAGQAVVSVYDRIVGNLWFDSFRWG